METIHLLRSQNDNEICFLLGGDLNQLDINPILQCYGALKQIVTEGTRKSAVLEFIITDLQGLYHPPSCIPPLEVDENKIGKNSDHNIVILAPINLPNNGPKRKKKIVRTRPLPESQIKSFGKFNSSMVWSIFHPGCKHKSKQLSQHIDPKTKPLFPWKDYKNFIIG